MAINPLKMDPSRTLTLRRAFMRDFGRRFRKLAAAVVKLVDDEDCFGLKQVAPTRSLLTNEATHNERKQFAFATDAQKVEEFNKWFKEQVDAGILELPAGGDPTKPWTSEYVFSAYKKGMLNAYTQVHKKLLHKSPDWLAGMQSEFIRDAFGQPESVSKLRLLGTRAYEGLKSITEDQASDVSRILMDGLANGNHPREMARKLVNELGMTRHEAERLARTEIIHAHSEGQLDAFEKLGVDDVGVMAEWSTAGDNRVCPRCRDKEGKKFKVKEAHGMIPLHPNCRCAFIPWLDDLPNDLMKLQRHTPKGFYAIEDDDD